MKQPINLFEYGHWERFGDSAEQLKAFHHFLDNIWQNRKNSTLSFDESNWENEEDDSEQQFLQVNFLKQIKANNYVGIIRYGETVINLLPKIFQQKAPIQEQDLQNIHAHLLWWLSHCTKLQFPKSWSSFNHIKSDFFEILIYLFAHYTKETLSKILYQTYQEVENELPYMKGRLDMPQYIRQNLSRGRWHQLSCVYSSFELDNRFNRIIKYVAKLLMSATQNHENKRLLSDILFMLDDVRNQRMTANDCEKVVINPLYKELTPILDYCRLFLTNSTILRFKNELEVFAFLLPMESIFEDFVIGFLQKHFNDDFNIQSQKSDKYLAALFYDNRLEKDKVFQLRHDIFLEDKKDKSRQIIIDTKYKKIYTNPTNSSKKHGVSQSDMYQMVSYAIRRNCQNIKLIYPNQKHSNNTSQSITFKVKDELSDDKWINIDVHEMPFLDRSLTLNPYLTLNEQFLPLEAALKDFFDEILKQ